MIDDPDNLKLVSDMIDVHGREAATVARENARAAALAGQAAQAKSWNRVLGTIQRQQAGKAPPIRTTRGPVPRQRRIARRSWRLRRSRRCSLGCPSVDRSPSDGLAITKRLVELLPARGQAASPG